MAIRKITHKDWNTEGKKRFGDDYKQWKFVCPKCKTVQTFQDLIDAGINEESGQGYLGFSCIGRFSACEKGCDWSLGGLFKIHTLEIIMGDHNRPVFEFADE